MKIQWPKQLFYSYKKTKRLFPIQIDITNSCNLKCTHCYHSHHSNVGALTLDDWYKVLIDCNTLLKKIKLKPRLIICGGEPLLNKDLISIISFACSLWGDDLEIAILTNGTTFNDILLKKLSKFNIQFQVSLDGPTPDLHDKKRGLASFDRSIKGIKSALNCNFSVIIQVILTQNTSEYIEDFFKLAASLNVDELNFVRFVETGHGKFMTLNNEDKILLPEQLKISFQKIVLFSRKYRIYTNKYSPLFNLIEPSIGGHSKFGFGIIIGYKGDYKISSRINYSIGNVLQTPIYKLYLQNPIMKSLRLGNITGCGSCTHYKRCGGDRNASYMKYGHFLGPDPGCWLNLKHTQN